MPSYGTGELYGFDFSALSPERIRQLSSSNHRDIECPFKPVEPGKPVRRCSKKGGVCSLRLFAPDADDVVKATGEPVITCPNRFLEANLVVRWVGEVLLGTTSPVVISELPFLMGEVQAEEEAEPDAVGKIDKVLVNPEGDSMRWCALEMQVSAVESKCTTLGHFKVYHPGGSRLEYGNVKEVKELVYETANALGKRSPYDSDE